MINYIVVILVSAFLGATMKIADLLDEHNFKWFKYSNLLFGLFWGISGAYLITINQILATIWISVLFCFIIRYRLDYFNHGIAAAIWFITMLYINYSLRDNLFPFIYFASLFTITGLMHDYFQYKNKNIKGIMKFFFIDFKLYWYLIALAYSLYSWDLYPILTIWTFEYVYDFFSSNKAEPLLNKLKIRQE
jgi:hypothetical protein